MNSIFLFTFLVALGVNVACAHTTKYKVSVKNLAYQQPFSGFFVMVHDASARPLYVMGKRARPALARLAEDGNAMPLIEAYDGAKGVYSVEAVPGPLFVGNVLEFYVYTTDDYGLLTIATMAINTNDCFCALNGVEISDGAVFRQPGLDAGSEENNELCTSIPGPACPAGSGNVRSKNGEGVVHVHRGFHGVNMGADDLSENDLGASGKPLSAAAYDWRNPMMAVAIEKVM